MKFRADESSRIVGLRQLLEEAPSPTPVVATAPAAPAAAHVTPPDPAVQLELERRRARESSEKAGYAAGMAKADEAIQAAVAEARKEVEQADAAAREELRAAAVRLDDVARTLGSQMDRLDASCVQLAVGVAATAVARILGQAYVDSDAMAAICRQALEEYRQRPVVIRLSADDVDAVREALAGNAEITIETDSVLKRGQCRLETDKGWYDTSLSTRFEAITRALLHGVEATP